MQKVVQRDSKQLLAVIIPGSENRPHFAAQSYIRDGPQTKQASEEQFERLITERNSKSREILKCLGKEITFRLPPGHNLAVGPHFYGGGGRFACRVLACNQFYVSVEFSREEYLVSKAYPLTFVEIGFDYAEKRLELIGLPY